MKELLTEWLVMYGTEWGPWHAGSIGATCNLAADIGYMDRREHIGELDRIHDFKLTPRGLEYLKDG